MSSSSTKEALIEGTLYKKGQVYKAWKQRYMVLYNNGILEYYENYYYYKEAVKNGKNNANPKNSKKEHEINLKEVKSFKVITTNEPSKKSDREYTFQLITNPRTYTISCQQKQQFNKWTKIIENEVYGQIIINGYIYRQGDVRKSHWKKQWFILYDSKKLLYYEHDQKITTAKGVINLQQIQGLGYGSEQQYESKTVIELKTNSKIYALKCLNQQDLQKWFDAILSTMKTDDMRPRSINLTGSLSESNIASNTKAKSPPFLAAKSLFNPIPIDFTLSDSEEENVLPQSGKFYEDQPFKFSSDIDKGKENKTAKQNEEHSKSASVKNIHMDITNGNEENEWTNDDNIDNEYRRMQVELAREWQVVMADVVIDKHHTLAMDASSNFCIARSKKIEAEKQSPLSPFSPKSADSALLASIPKMKSTKSFTKSRDSSGSLIPSFEESDCVLEPYEFDSVAPDLDKLASMTIPKKLKLQHSNTAESKLSDEDVEIPDFPEAIFSAKSEMLIDVDAEEDENNKKNRKKHKREKKMKLFANCPCISRLVIILRAYEKWMQYKIDHQDQLNDNEGFRGMISVLNDYNLSDLLNDYYHIKRFHVESTKTSKNSNSDNIKTAVLDPDICKFFKQQISTCNVLKSLSFKRNINEKTKNESNEDRKEKYLLNRQSSLASSRETVEIVTQQIMDTIHCYVFHLSHCIRNIVGGHAENKFVTMTTSINNDDLKEEALAPSTSRMYSRFDSHFGSDHNQNDNLLNTEQTAKYSSIKFEVLECDQKLSQQEWIEIYYKSELFLQAFESNKLRCKKDLEINKHAKFKKNSFMSTELVLSILLYCNYNSLQSELKKSYRDSNHHHKFYHFGCALFAVINGYGVNMFDDNTSSMRSTHFYHCFSSPVVFQKLRCDFNGGPVSMTIIPSIVFTNMYSDQYKDGIIVEMDINGSGSINYFDVSIFSNFAYESERLFYGQISLSITNIIESDISSCASIKRKKFNYHSNYLNAITLLRMIIGDCTMHKSHYLNNVICERLTLLISLEVNSRRNKNNKKIANRQLVPEYICKLFNSWCMNTKGVIVLKLADVLKLSQPRLQSYFLTKPRAKKTIRKMENAEVDRDNQISLSYKILFQIFPFVTKILCYGIPFNEYLCETFSDFLSSDDYKNYLQKESKMDECILQFTDNEQPYDEWSKLIEKYQNVLDENECGWTIKAKVPDSNSFDGPKISFVKDA